MTSSENTSPIKENSQRPQPAVTSSAPTNVAANLETGNLIEGYQVIAEWIRFADAKAAVVLTVAGAAAGLLVPTLKGYLAEADVVHPTAWWEAMVGVLFAVWLLFLVLSGVCAFLCILPFRRKGKHPVLGHSSHFHPAAISAAFSLNDVERFISDCDSMGDDALRKEVAACLLIDSHISSAKYGHVTRAIRFLGVSCVTALLYWIAIQF